jgi:hypothetical protein
MLLELLKEKDLLVLLKDTDNLEDQKLTDLTTIEDQVLLVQCYQ